MRVKTERRTPVRSLDARETRGTPTRRTTRPARRGSPAVPAPGAATASPRKPRRNANAPHDPAGAPGLRRSRRRAATASPRPAAARSPARPAAAQTADTAWWFSNHQTLPRGGSIVSNGSRDATDRPGTGRGTYPRGQADTRANTLSRRQRNGNVMGTVRTERNGAADPVGRPLAALFAMTPAVTRCTRCYAPTRSRIDAARSLRNT